MSPLNPAPTAVSSLTVLRNEPVQARSNVRLTGLLDAAAAVIDEVGFERLTTAMVAERADSSIGTVYRYFPDRIAVLHALSERSLARFAGDGLDRVGASTHVTWLDAVSAAFDYWVSAFRSEPGFRSLRFGDVLDLRPRALSNNSAVAATIVSVLTSRHGMKSDKELQFHIEISLEICDALLARAFSIKPTGDKKFVTEATSTARAYLVGVYGDPALAA